MEKMILKRWLRYFMLSLGILLCACGAAVTSPTQAAGTDTGKYVFCIVGYGNAHSGSSASSTNWGVIGYDVVGEPQGLDNHDRIGSFLQVQTTTGHKLIFSSQCYYTEDNPKNLDVSWQTR